MNQRHIFTALAIIAITGSVSVPNSLAGLATSAPPDVQLEYDDIWPEQATQNERSRYGMKDKSGSGGEERPAETHPDGNFRNSQSPVSPTGPYREYLSGVPTTPSADPSVQDLSHAPSPR